MKAKSPVIKDVRIYSRALSAQEMYYIYLKRSSSSSAG